MVLFGLGRRKKKYGDNEREEGKEKEKRKESKEWLTLRDKMVDESVKYSLVVFHSCYTDCLPDELIFVAGCQIR